MPIFQTAQSMFRPSMYTFNHIAKVRVLTGNPAEQGRDMSLLRLNKLFNGPVLKYGCFLIC
jgi:hypothetical protein